MMMQLAIVGLPDGLGPRHFRVNADSAAEALRAFVVNFPLSLGWIARQNFAVYADDRNLSEVEAFGPLPDSELQFVPAIGGGGPLVMIAAGAAMVGVTATGVFAGMTIAGLSVASMVASIGVSMVLSGVASLLTPKTKGPTASQREKPENVPSAYFNGAVNTSEPGHCVAVGYGTMMIGSQVISAGLSSENF